jgi:predicted transcriptional regulator
MGSRVGFWADDELDERLNSLVEAMQKSPVLRDLDITKGAIIKAAIRRGLPFMELEQGIHPFSDEKHNPLLIGWLDTTILELLERAEQLDLELPHYSKRKK